MVIFNWMVFFDFPRIFSSIVAEVKYTMAISLQAYPKKNMW